MPLQYAKNFFFFFQESELIILLRSYKFGKMKLLIFKLVLKKHFAEKISPFNLNTGKCVPEITPYLDTFRAVLKNIRFLKKYRLEHGIIYFNISFKQIFLFPLKIECFIKMEAINYP